MAGMSSVSARKCWYYAFMRCSPVVYTMHGSDTLRSASCAHQRLVAVKPFACMACTKSQQTGQSALTSRFTAAIMWLIALMSGNGHMLQLCDQPVVFSSCVLCGCFVINTSPC